MTKRLRKSVKFTLIIIIIITCILFTKYSISHFSTNKTNQNYYKEFEEEIGSKNLVGYWSFDKNTNDLSKNKNHGTPKNNVKINKKYAHFDGIDDTIEIADNNDYSISTTGSLSISVWVKPDTFNFKNTSENGYVNFMGKGNSYWPEPNQEWGFRVYSDKNTEKARNYVFYVFNLSGGFGVGSRVQEQETEGKWIHLVGVTDGNFTYIYKNGKLIDKDPYTRYNIVPQNGKSPMNFGWRDEDGGFFEGSLDEIMIFNKTLTESEIAKLYILQKNKIIKN